MYQIKKKQLLIKRSYLLVKNGILLMDYQPSRIERTIIIFLSIV